ncbi:MAG: hypothetical protein EDM79_12145 [Chloroflexi bacterium]|nr:MAG: hypothetical protein EDM79_12145 [Chloroflexota bacterium]
MKDILRQFANLFSVLIALTVNVLASTLPLNGQNTGEISDRFPVYFVPAGYVFAIWSVIFIGWIAFAIYQFQPSQKESPRLRRLGYLFALSGLANAGWLFCWHYNHFGLSVLVMLLLLGLLIASYLRLDVNRFPVSAVERWSVDIPFSVYLGWITGNGDHPQGCGLPLCAGLGVRWNCSEANSRPNGREHRMDSRCTYGRLDRLSPPSPRPLRVI